MAIPANPLDKFVGYTYHFELHAATSIDALKEVEGGTNESTERNAPNKTLLINTRKDAHQHITEVMFEYISPGSIPGAVAAPLGDISIRVEEPGAAFFYEKIQRAIENGKVTSFANLVFGLKIFFIGRLPNDSSEIYDKIPMLYMMLEDFQATFNFKGGVYSMKFAPAAAAAIVTAPTNPRSAYAYSFKGFGIEANDLKDALAKMEEAIQRNYDNWFENDVDISSSTVKRIKYKINCGLDGKFQTSNANSTSEATKFKMTFDQQMQIVDMIHKVVMRSPEVLKQLAASYDANFRPLHKGAFGYSIIPRVLKGKGEDTVIFDIVQYGESDPARDTFDFNFYFSGAGQNIDVLDFDLKIEFGLAMFVGGSSSDDEAGNISGRMQLYSPLDFSRKNVHQDKSIAQEVQSDDKRVRAPELKENDTAHPPVTPSHEIQAYNGHRVDNVSTAREAFSAFTALISATGDEKTLRIRGHAGLLYRCWSGPNSNENGFGVSSGLWVKVNIYDEQGRQYFYRDYYRLFTVKNVFQNGMFTQELVLIAMPRTSAAQVKTSIPENRPYADESARGGAKLAAERVEKANRKAEADAAGASFGFDPTAP